MHWMSSVEEIGSKELLPQDERFVRVFARLKRSLTKLYAVLRLIDSDSGRVKLPVLVRV